MGLDWTSTISFREYSIFCVIRMWVDLAGYGPSHFSKSVFWAQSWASVSADIEGHGHGTEPIALLGW